MVGRPRFPAIVPNAKRLELAKRLIILSSLYIKGGRLFETRRLFLLGKTTECSKQVSFITKYAAPCQIKPRILEFSIRGSQSNLSIVCEEKKTVIVS